jgi:hypothetical protein
VEAKKQNNEKIKPNFISKEQYELNNRTYSNELLEKVLKELIEMNKTLDEILNSREGSVF